MLTSANRSQDFTQLAKQTLVENGVLPSDALSQATGKMLARLATSEPVPQASDVGVTYEAMLRRCALV
ncbi:MULTISPECIES: hypothetical protein [Limnohabitans]|jgi:hypothetical protein|uniref:hypothetical protein n=1 Tax=Limnohabitans TaxID=665874 RepID=UPI00130497ED|nr:MULTISPECIES: hypothetical protein [Limnohabitans]